MQDPQLGPLLQSKEAGTNPEADELIGKSLEAKRLFSSATSCLWREGCYGECLRAQMVMTAVYSLCSPGCYEKKFFKSYTRG